jgi:vanillate O-demethylase monooxygenase subunit
MFPRNFWYVAAWDDEVKRGQLMRRTICGQPIVLWRKEDGTPAALEDRCAHRHMPLSDGFLRGDNVECPYHGLTYDASGACVRIPSQNLIPPSVRVRSFPVVERYHWVWLWMGDPALADPAAIGASRAPGLICRAITCCWSTICSTSHTCNSSIAPRSGPRRSRRCRSKPSARKTSSA